MYIIGLNRTIVYNNNEIGITSNMSKELHFNNTIVN